MGIKGFLETSFVDWPGRLAAVVFLSGCNFRCPFCHNPELVDGGGGLPDIPLEDVLAAVGRLRGWVDSLVVTGGEPTVHAGLPHLLKAFRKAGLSVKLDTNGSRPGLLARLISEGLVGQVDMDLKAPLRDNAYTRLCGVKVELGRVRESIEVIHRSGLPHRFRTTFVPGLLERGDIREIRSSLPSPSPLILQAFRPGRVLDPALEAVSPPTAGEMKDLRALDAGIVAA